MLNLPVELTPFIGRNKELDELARLLTDPKCRLISLVGPGGSGKTRLAIEAARDSAAHYSDGVFFVNLQPLVSDEFLISSIADSLGYSLRGSEQEGQLLDYLQNKSLLLVLDNFEHLLSAVDLLNLILVRAPILKLLVTSREVLNLREEWLYPVQGMSFPAEVTDANPENYGAVQLFVEHARRVRRDFSLDDERVHVVRLCQLVEGIPLALELAASWLKSLTCNAIISQIESNPDFLNTPLRNIPPRHRSMRAVFAQSWKLLTDAERQVFKRLSVFRGGFQHEAAKQVAGASLHMLSALVDKSLIRYEPNQRYQMHELLRQYAIEQLSHSVEEIQRVHDTHANYYMELLQRREPDLNSARQRETIQELEAELDNIRAAWKRAVHEANITALQKGCFAFYNLHDMRGRYQECLDAIEAAVQRLEAIEDGEERDFTLAILHGALGGLFIRLGRFEEAKTASDQSILLYFALNRRPPAGFGTNPLSNMGLLAVTVGDYGAAVAFGEEALKGIDASDKLNLMFVLYVLASATYSQGQSEAAFGYAQRAYQFSDGLGDGYFSAYILIVMGNIAQALEDYRRAWEYYQTSYTLKQGFNEPGGTAFALNCMARIAWLNHDYQEAQSLYQQGYDLYREVNDPGGIATSLLGLADTAQARGDYPAAQINFQQALKVAIQIRWTPLILAILVAVSDLLIRLRAIEQAMELLVLASQHPASERLTKIRAEQTLIRVGSKLPASKLAKVAAAAKVLDPYAAALALREEFGIGGAEGRFAPVRPESDTDRGNQFLSDSLSERELEILRLLAKGLSNQQIAERLILVVGTVKAHNHHIFDKLGVSNRVQAITRARELGLL